MHSRVATQRPWLTQPEVAGPQHLVGGRAGLHQRSGSDALLPIGRSLKLRGRQSCRELDYTGPDKPNSIMAKRTCWLAFVIVGCLGTTKVSADDLPADKAADKVSFYRDIRPIFQRHCNGCHQPAKASGEYVMTDHASLLKGGETGEVAIVPGKPETSYLIGQITPEDGEASMPQGKPPLADAERELIERWIREGAEDDRPASATVRFDPQNPPVYDAPPVITSVAFSPTEALLAVSAYHEVVLHRQQPDGSWGLVGRLIGQSERIESAVFSPDGKRLAVTGGSPGRLGELQIWDVKTQQLLRSLTVGYDTCYGASWSPDGKLVGIGCPDNSVRAFDAETGEQKLFNGAHNDWVLDTVFSKDGSHLVTVSRDRSMKLMEVATQRFVDNITSITPGALKGGLNAVDRHPQEDHLLAGGADGVPKLYRMIREKARKIGDDYNLIRAYPGMPGRVYSVEFSRDGKLIVAGSSYNGKGHVRAYQTEDGKSVFSADLEDGGIYCVAISHDQQWIAAGGFDGHVRIYQLDSTEPKSIFPPVPLAEEKATD